MKSKGPMLHAKLLVVTMSLTLTGCVTTTGSNAPTKAPFCAVSKPFYWSARDTESSIAQAKEHNAVGKELCGW